MTSIKSDLNGVEDDPANFVDSTLLCSATHTKEDGNHIYRLHALDVTTGEEKFGGPTVIEATVAGTSHFDSHDGQIVFDPSQHLQRPGILLLNNVVYIGFGSHDDIGIWHGWFLGYNAANIQQQVSALNTSPDGWGASIWQGGRAPAVDEQGNIYWGTGNGSFDGKQPAESRRRIACSVRWSATVGA